MTARRSQAAGRLKVRIPLLFEAEGEGLILILCLAALCGLFVVRTYLAAGLS